MKIYKNTKNILLITKVLWVELTTNQQQLLLRGLPIPNVANEKILVWPKVTATKIVAPKRVSFHFENVEVIQSCMPKAQEILLN